MNATHELLYGRRSNSSYDIAFLTVADISEFLGMSKSKLYKDIRDGKLQAEKNLDETTVISPRALQSAYPNIDVANIFELDQPESLDDVEQIKSTDLNRATQASDINSPKPIAKPQTGLSSLEKALDRQASNRGEVPEPCTETFSKPTPSESMVTSNDDDIKLNAQKTPENKLNLLTAALILASSILLVVLAVL